MDEKIQQQIDMYQTWTKENLGDVSGTWYSKILSKLGEYLEEFELYKGYNYHNSFFEYTDYKEFKEIYQQITGDSEKSIEKILAGGKPNYDEEFRNMNEMFIQKYAELSYQNDERNSKNDTGGIPSLGTCLRSYLKFLYYSENSDKVYPKSVNKTDNKQYIDDFKTWLEKQEKSNGDYLDFKTVNVRIACLKDIEKEFNTEIFTETNVEQLISIKETVLNEGSYTRYKGITSVALNSFIRYIESKPTKGTNEKYILKDFLDEIFIDELELNTLLSVLRNKKNLILKGAPGVGKTFIADRLAYLMMEEKDHDRVQMIQFHQSYSYEDFIEGYRPTSEGKGFEIKEGPFVKFARTAQNDPNRDYFFIIDEINRGNMSKIFGELMMLIETDKRNKSINLLYSNERFLVPSNLYIIGMMNTADRSLALLDYALRRRFSFFEIKPSFDNDTFKQHINKYNDSNSVNKVIDKIKELNKVIVEELGTGFQIGHSYFIGEAFNVNAKNRIKEVVEYEIIPQLYEYWFDDEQKAMEWADTLRSVIDNG